MFIYYGCDNLKHIFSIYIYIIQHIDSSCAKKVSSYFGVHNSEIQFLNNLISLIEVKCRLIDNMRKHFGLETINYDFAREEGFTLHSLGE